MDGIQPRPPQDSAVVAPEDLARVLRHEIGDFLQKVYATVAILQDRLPDDCTPERDILRNLRRRAEGCKDLINAVQDYLCPLTVDPEPVDLTPLLGGLLEAARGEHPDLNFVARLPGSVPVLADPTRVARVGQMVLQNACEAARGQVVVQAGPGADRQVEWTVTDDGPGVPPELTPRLFTPFFTTRPGHAGLGLALARKIVRLHGGRIDAVSLPAGGFQVRVSLPAAGP